MSFSRPSSIMFSTAVLCLLSACAPSESNVTLPSETTPTTPSSAGSASLAKGQVLRAIIARSRAAGPTTRPAQTRLRKYSREGRLLSEKVWSPKDSSFVASELTLSSDALSRPLMSFLPRSSSGLSGVAAPLPSLVAMSMTETVEGQSITVSDTATTDYGPLYTSLWQSASVDTFDFGSDFFWTDSLGSGIIASSTGGVMVVVDPLDNSFVEVIYSEVDWSDMLSYWQADTAAAGVPSLMSQFGAGREAEGASLVSVLAKTCPQARLSFLRAAGTTGANLVLAAALAPEAPVFSAFWLRRALTVNLGVSLYQYRAMREACGV